MSEIRRAEKQDFEEVMLLLTQIQNLHAENREDIFVYGQAVMERSEFEKMIGHENCVMLVAEEDGKAVGMIVLQIKMIELAIMKPRKVGIVDDFVVDESFRGRGIGQMLFDAVKRAAIEKRCESLELNVWSFNEKAIRFYRKNGMEIQRITLEEKLS